MPRVYVSFTYTCSLHICERASGTQLRTHARLSAGADLMLVRGGGPDSSESRPLILALLSLGHLPIDVHAMTRQVSAPAICICSVRPAGLC